MACGLVFGFISPRLAQAEVAGTMCEGVFKNAKYYVIQGKAGVVYVEGRSGDQPMARYTPEKAGNPNEHVIQTGGVHGTKKFEDTFFRPAKLPGWGWVVRKYEGDPDKTQFVWFGLPESEPAEIKPIKYD